MIIFGRASTSVGMESRFIPCAGRNTRQADIPRALHPFAFNAADYPDGFFLKTRIDEHIRSMTNLRCNRNQKNTFKDNAHPALFYADLHILHLSTLFL